MYQPGISFRIGQPRAFTAKADGITRRVENQLTTRAQHANSSLRHRDAYHEVSTHIPKDAIRWCNGVALETLKQLRVDPWGRIGSDIFADFLARWVAFETGGDLGDVTVTRQLGFEAGGLNISRDEAASHRMTKEQCFDVAAVAQLYVAPLYRRASGCVARALKQTPTTEQLARVLTKYAHGAGSGAAFVTFPPMLKKYIKPGGSYTADAVVTGFLNALADADGVHYPTVYREFGPIHARTAAFCAGVPLAIADRTVSFGRHS